MIRKIFLCGFLTMVSLVIMISCATTELTSVWKDSSYQGGPIKKILIIGVFKEGNLKRYFEDEFARQLKTRGVDAVPSYTIFPEEDVLDKETITSKIKELKMDSVLITRVMDVTDVSGYETYPTHVDPGGTFYDYYVLCCQTVVSVGYVVVMETRIFEEKYDKLIWSASSETSLQRSREYTFKSFIQTMINDLSYRHLIR